MTMRADLPFSPTRRAGLIAVAGSLLLAACSQMSPGSLMSSRPDTNQFSDLSGAALDTAFVTRAMQSDMLEITASQMALRRPTSQEVHRFARQMVDDHTTNGTELTQLAQQLGMASSPPNPTQADRMKLQQLQEANDTEFERLYIQMIGLDAHTEAVALFRQESANGGNQSLRAFAGRKVPALEHHLAMAKTLQPAAR